MFAVQLILLILLGLLLVYNNYYNLFKPHHYNLLSSVLKIWLYMILLIVSMEYEVMRYYSHDLGALLISSYLGLWLIIYLEREYPIIHISHKRNMNNYKRGSGKNIISILKPTHPYLFDEKDNTIPNAKQVKQLKRFWRTTRKIYRSDKHEL